MAGWDEVKRLFAEALTRPESEREPFLREAEKTQAELVRQVRDLLAHHQSRTLFEAGAPTTTRGKPVTTNRRTSSLRTHWWHRSWARWALVIGLLVTGVGTALWLRALASRSLMEAATKTLATTARITASFIETQIEDWRSQTQRLAMLYEADLLELIRKPDEGQQEKVAEQLARLIRPESFSAWAVLDARGPLLAASSQFRPGLVASPATMAHIGELNKGGEVVAFPSGRNRLVAEWEGEGELFPETILLAPIRGRGGAVRGVFALLKRTRSDVRVSDVTQYGNTGEVLLFLPDGLSLGTPRFIGAMTKAGLVTSPKDSRALPVVYLRDPGRPLESGLLGDPDSWPETLPVRLTQAALHARKQGDNGPRFRVLEPYRDYRGHDVIGVWRYLPRYGVALAAKADMAEIRAPLRYFHLAFLSLLLLALAAPAYFILLGPGRLASDPYKGQFGPYTLLEKVGEGGTGEVYLASHSMLRRPAAVKILRRDRLTPALLEQFEREVQLASHLRHPNTIEIYDFGVTPEGSPFCAMEYLAGHDLAYWIKRGGPMPAARVRHIARQICGSLREAHAAGLLHRDLKPANIMLCELGGEVDFVKLLDFGLARPVARPDETSTSPAALAGTPYYIAPERLEGRTPIDARSDFYSLGVLLYYLLTGAMPFGDNVSWMQATLSEEPIPLERRGVRIPPAFEALLMQCLSRDPADRPGAAGDLLEVLEQLETETPWTPADAMNAWAGLPAPSPS